MLAGWDAAPAGGARNPAPGRPREPIGRYYGRSAGSLLDWDWAEMPSSQETRTRGTEIAAVERREAPASFKRGCGKTEDGSASRRSTPSPIRGGRKGKTAYPAPQRIRAMTLGCLTIESDDAQQCACKRGAPERGALPAMPAMGVGDGAAVPRIVIDVTVLGIETVIAAPGAAHAPVPIMRCQPDMPRARPGIQTKLRCI